MKVKGILYSLAALALVGAAMVCVCLRVPVVMNGDDALLAAATLTISKGNVNTTVKVPKKNNIPNKKNTNTPKVTQPVTSSNFSANYYNTFSNHKNAKKYPVYTKQFVAGGKKYQNFYVKNNTNLSLNIGKSLNSPLGFKLEKTEDVQVLIYHTHTGESYLDCDVGYYYSDYYPRTSDNRYNVTRVGEEIAKSLKAAGISVIHDTTEHDAAYTGSYLRSRATVNSYLKKYPKIKVTLDIHRDAIGAENYKVKPTFTYKGKKGAQIMIMSGYDSDGSLNFPKWNYNLRFALKLQQKCAADYAGMTRPLDFGNFAYNMNINTGSLLVEFGTDSNTLEEAKYSGKLFGKALAQVLQNNS